MEQGSMGGYATGLYWQNEPHEWFVRSDGRPIGCFSGDAIELFMQAEDGELMQGLIEGRIVHFVLASGPCEGEHRPAMIVRVKRNEEGVVDPAGICDLCVFTRGMDLDGYPDYDLREGITFNEQPVLHTWHWVEQA